MTKENINFIIDYAQAVSICEHYGKNIDELEDWEVEELLDKLIDDACYGVRFG